MSSEVERNRLAKIEQMLNRIGSEVAGNQKFTGQQIASLVEELGRLEQLFTAEVARIDSRLDKVAEWAAKIDKALPTKGS